MEKFLKKFPFDEPLLQHLEFLDPDMKDKLTKDSGMYSQLSNAKELKCKV